MTLAIQKAESEITLDLKTAIERQFVAFEATVTAKINATLAKIEARMMRWMIGFWIGQMAVILAAIKLFK